jgi:hypothetical protein
LENDYDGIGSVTNPVFTDAMTTGHSDPLSLDEKVYMHKYVLVVFTRAMQPLMVK